MSYHVEADDDGEFEWMMSGDGADWCERSAYLIDDHRAMDRRIAAVQAEAEHVGFRVRLARMMRQSANTEDEIGDVISGIRTAREIAAAAFMAECDAAIEALRD